MTLYQYLLFCGQHRMELGKQLYVLGQIDAVARDVKRAKSRESQLEVAVKGLTAVVFPDRFGLPLDPRLEACGLIPGKCKVMSSKKLPLTLVFQLAPQRRSSSAAAAAAGATASSDTFTAMYKVGDDLRQDQLTLQVLMVMNRLWKEEGLDLEVQHRVFPAVVCVCWSSHRTC